MLSDKRTLLKNWLGSSNARLEPLTYPQRELWETSSAPVVDMANHICCLIFLQGPVTARECEAAIQRVAERQEVLRLSILPGKERPLQMIRESCDANFRYRELPASQYQAEAIEELAQEVFSSPFDLVRGPLYRVEFLRRAPDDHVLLFAIHHAIADGWALAVFVKDWCTAYALGLGGSRGGLPLPEVTYSAWGAAERAYWQPPEIEQRAAFWKDRLAGARRPWGARQGSATAPGALLRLVTHWPPELNSAARELARRNGATLFSTLLAAFQVTLFQWTGCEDVVVGTPVANRSRQGVRETMGYCSGTVPLRGRIDRAVPFSANLRAVHQTTVDCFANAMPFAELAQALGERPSPGRHPIFETRFALQNHPAPHLTLPGLSAKLRMRSSGTARFHLACEMTDGTDGFEVVWLFRPGLFTEEEIGKLGCMFQSVLKEACRSPERRTSDLTI